MTELPPNPGSSEAVDQGCSCAVMDNCYGRGFPYGGKTCFYVSGDCPLHANTQPDGMQND